MKRIILSDKDLDKVIELRQTGARWLKIQEQTGINRHVAKRNYEEWERKQSADDLKGVRLKVAEEEFKQHLGHLTKVAEFLIDNLSIPSSPNNNERAEHFLDRLWQRRIIEEPSLEMKANVRNRRQAQRIARQNKLLFQSLKDHTREKIRWEALSEWKSGWDDSIDTVKELREELRVLIGNILKQKPELLFTLQKGRWGKDTLAHMVSTALNTIWKGIIDDKIHKVSSLVKTRPDIDGGDEVTSVDVGEKALLKFTERKTGEDFVKVLNWGIDNLRKGNKAFLLEQLSREVQKMEMAINGLEEALDPLLIRPLIIRTKCVLCPA